MSILNLGLQNVSLEHQQGSEATERALKDCRSMNDIRKLAEKSPDIRRVWVESVMPPRSIIESHFSHLKLKDKPIQVDDPVSEDDVNKLMSRISEMFPDLDVTKLQKAHTRKSFSYNKWKEEHCRERKYTFQIKKCGNPNCCLPLRLPCEMLKWLPDPVLAEDGDHFKKYNEVIISHFSEFRRECTCFVIYFT